MKSMFCKLIRRKKKGRDADTKSTSAPSALEDELPVEVKRHVASFLSVRDLLKFSETSKQINRDLNVVVLSSPLRDRVSQNKAFQTDETTECFATFIPNREESQSHSHHLMTFAFHVVTTPFIIGIIWVVEQDVPSNQSVGVGRPEIFPFWRGKTVAKTTLITSSRAVNLPFFPKTGKFYQIWVSIQQFDDDSELYLNNMMFNYVSLGRKLSRRAAFEFGAGGMVVQFRGPPRGCLLL